MISNIREAFYGHGTADFIAKLQIALKECSESEYWLELLIESGYYDNRDILDKCILVLLRIALGIKTDNSGSKMRPIASLRRTGAASLCEA